MISNATILSMIAVIIFSIFLFVSAILITKKRVGLSLKPLLIGSVGFVIITQVLEKLLHVVVITGFPNYAEHPWAFGLYGGFAAGIFEELGRYFLFIWLLKKYQDFKGGLSFGVGWGGIEAVVIALSTVVPFILFATMINAGTFDSSIGASLPSDQAATIKETVLNQGVSHYLWGIPERFFALLMQIAFTLLVLLAVIKKKLLYVLLAIVAHAAIDFPVTFYQTGYIKSLWVIEMYLAFVGVLSILIIKRLRKLLVG
ncbi:YhfC family intramembrane metalloprotease [Robertmurraya korlensis]|uniref:YhfC family intramembrane metalloprotease n=1 Tax=Robertmurraya korlensis TaxID=519977 RepID=UPI000824AB18|nr:YhfC family glutamic-type intramembrane protease [Robertmurraya korlensis]